MFTPDIASWVTCRLAEQALPVVLSDGLAEGFFDLDADEILHIGAMVHCCESRNAGACLGSRVSRMDSLQIAQGGAGDIRLRLEARRGRQALCRCGDR